MDPAETIIYEYDEQSSGDNYTEGSQDANDDYREGLPEIPVKVILKQKQLQITTEQKEIIYEFIQENPELVTHSSTLESERDLWEELTKKLNELKPEKSEGKWKDAWYRWHVSVFKKSEAKLTCLDKKLKKFLKQLKSGSDDKIPFNRPMNIIIKPKKRLNSKQIDDRIKVIEKEKYSLHLTRDENEINILKFKSIIRALENHNFSIDKRMRKLNEEKMYLHNAKKRKIEDSQTESIEVLEKQLIQIEKELAES